MARGKKKYTPTEELEMIGSKIEAAEAEIKQLKSRKKELEKSIQETDLRELYDIVKKSGKSIVEVLAMVESLRK